MKLSANETITMQSDQLDDGSIVVNFDIVDDSQTPIIQGGYVIVRQSEEGFTVVCIDGQGDIVNEYLMTNLEAYNGQSI